MDLNCKIYPSGRWLIDSEIAPSHQDWDEFLASLAVQDITHSKLSFSLQVLNFAKGERDEPMVVAQHIALSDGSEVTYRAAENVVWPEQQA